MHRPTLTLNFDAGAAVTKRRLVKMGAADETVIQAAAATDVAIGVSSNVDAASGDRCDVHLTGVAEVDFGGTIARGARVTADSNGKAVATTTDTNAVAGVALVSGVDGDIGYILIAPGMVAG